jgi:hypothetical protein
MQSQPTSLTQPQGALFRETPQTQLAYIARKPEDKPLHLAHYLKDDLLAYLNDASAPLDLHRWLDLPRGQYPQKPEYMVHLLCDDIDMLIRDKLITTVHVIFSDLEMINDHYEMTYHARYFVTVPEWVGRHPEVVLGRGASTRAAPETMRDKHFMVLVDWLSGITRARIASMRRHRHFFDWIASSERFDRRTMATYRQGGVGGTPGNLQSLPRPTSKLVP